MRRRQVTRAWLCYLAPMSPTRLLCALTLVVAACSAPNPAAAPAAPRPAPLTDSAPAAFAVDRAHLTAELDRFIASHGRNWGPAYAYSGFVLVAHAGEVIYGRGFGLADRQARVVPSAATSFRIGSATKQFTAAAILELEEQGKLHTGDTIATHLPDYPQVGAAITIHQLLTHTAGIPNYTNFPEVMEARSEAISVDQLLATFADKPLDFTPGSAWSYSNSGYIVLGAIIEQASGQSYADFMRESIFIPAGLTRTKVGDGAGEDSARGYRLVAGELVDAEPIDMSVAYAAGGIRSTAADLLEWHRVLAGDKILGAAARAKLYRVDKKHYAYGWRVVDRDGHRFVSHGGGIDGFLTSFTRVVDIDLVVVAWSNNESIQSEPVAAAAIEAALGGALAPVSEPEAGELHAEVAKLLVGRYRLTDESLSKLGELGVPGALIETLVEVEVGVKEGLLTFDPTGQPQISLMARGAASFLHRESGIEIKFAVEVGGDTPAASLEVVQGPLTMEYRRAQ